MHKLTKAQMNSRKKRRFLNKPIRRIWREWCQAFVQNYNSKTTNR